jgi:photosystem II stability/assembly factor-like uncharacterized protein
MTQIFCSPDGITSSKDMVKHIFFYSISCFVLICGSTQAQPWAYGTSGTLIERSTFSNVQNSFNSYWLNRAISKNESENAGGYQQFKRWEYMMSIRTYPSGEYFDPGILLREYFLLKEKYRGVSSREAGTSGNWRYIGHNSVPITGGAGRINVVRIHPLDPNIIYVGAACGGVWNSLDGGQTWATTTDFLSSISIADIAIDPVNPDNIFIATGDGNGYVAGPGHTKAFFGGLYAGGIFISTDGGQTWGSTALNYSQSENQIFNRIVINPANPSVLITCSSSGILRSEDKGVTWNQVQTGRFYDLEFMPNSPNVVYASGSSSIYKSTNGGVSFTATFDAIGFGRSSISVTNINPGVLYVLSESGDFWKSNNQGETFNKQTSPYIATQSQGYYDNMLSVSPVDEDFVVVGGIELVKSFDGGQTWSKFIQQVHVDHHGFEFDSGGMIAYSANDGGVYKSTDVRTASSTYVKGQFLWTDISNNLQIKQYYKIASSPSNPVKILAGAQDNGTDYFDGQTWTMFGGGD